LENPQENDKLNQIREINVAGFEVQHVIVQHGIKEEAAFAVEAALIDFSERFGLSLTNMALGHRSHAFGIMTASEVQQKYSAKPLTSLGDDCVIININRTYERAKASKSYYEATKKAWVISEKRIPSIKYVLSEYRSFIVEVFAVNENGWYKTKDHNGRQRWGFDGKQAPDPVRSQYLNRSIAKRRGRANPVTFQLGSAGVEQSD
jgi:hypothetical protein